MVASVSPRARLRWVRRRPATLTTVHEQVFLNMHKRKMARDLNGTQERNKKGGVVALFVLLVLIYGAGAGASSGTDEQDSSKKAITVTLELWQIVAIGVWLLISVIITATFGQNKFILLLFWMVVYWPLLALLTSLVFFGDLNPFSNHPWIMIAFIVAEILSFVIFVTIHYLYPWLIGELIVTQVW
jgi:hypothetical protein